MRERNSLADGDKMASREKRGGKKEKENGLT